MSIQTRLTFCFTFLFGIIVVGLAIGSYILMRNNLYSDLKTELQVAVDGTAMSAEHEFTENSTALRGEADLQAVLEERGKAALPDTQILVRQGSREVAYKAGAQSAIDLRAIPANQLQAKSFHDLRIASRDLPIRKFNSRYQIYAAASTTFVTQRLRRVALTLVLLVPVGLLLAASAGYVLARKSLAPLNDLSTTIESVTSSDLGLRVSVASGADEISRIGRRFNSLLNRLQQAFDSQQRFMADASHELRTPVTVALAAAQVTVRDPLRTQHDSDEALRLVEVQMLRVKNIVQQLLLLSQADASSLKVNMSDVYLDDVVTEASRAARALAHVKQQRLDAQPLPEARIQGDSDLLGQALMILLDNAVKFTPPGGNIQVGISRRGQYWVCHVVDNGIGIPASEQARVFDRFYRAVENPAAADVAGSGLGLAIAKAIIDAHGGTLTVAESRPGLTRFEIRLLSAEGEGNGPREQHQPSSCAVRI